LELHIKLWWVLINPDGRPHGQHPRRTIFNIISIKAVFKWLVVVRGVMTRIIDFQIGLESYFISIARIIVNTSTADLSLAGRREC